MALLDFLEQPSTITKIGNQTISYGDNPHANPIDFDVWWQPFMIAPPPWTFFSGRWYSNVAAVNMYLPGLWAASQATATATIDIPINNDYEIFDTFIRKVTFDTRTVNVAQSATAFWSFNFRYYSANLIGNFSNPPTANIITFGTGTYTTANRTYRQTFDFNTLAANVKGFEIVATETGAAGTMNCTASISFRLVRK